jgi:catalase-peroxidase
VPAPTGWPTGAAAPGGQQRFEPLNSWPDNVNLDKARRLLWPIKQKYGRNISWADLMVLAGTVAMEDMGFKTFGFAGGRADDWEPDLVYWGPEAGHARPRALQTPKASWRTPGRDADGPDLRESGRPGRQSRSAAAAKIRVAFGRMAMNDEETVALIAGGHTFGKTHGAGKPDECVGAEPAAAPIEQQGWAGPTSAARATPKTPSAAAWKAPGPRRRRRWTMMYLSNLFNYDWEQTRSPAGAIQWTPKDGAAADTVPDAHVEGLSPRADHVHDGPGAEGRPRLPRDLPALPGQPGGIRARLRQGLVQADPPRHGAPRPLLGDEVPKKC